MTLTFFALISFLALKEYCTLISVHFPRWLYWGIPLNYLLIGFNCFELFLLFIPLAGFLILATGQVLVGDPSGFLHTVSAIFWGWIMTVFALSHAAWLLMLPTTNIQGGALLVLFLLALTESNDIAQYLWGKSCGRRKVVPKVSPGKNIGRSDGRRHHHHDCVTDYRTVTDTAKYITGIISGFVNWY